MNCPSRTEEADEHPDWNQNPGALAGDLTTRQDLNGIANLRLQRDHLPPDTSVQEQSLDLQKEESLDRQTEILPPDPLHLPPASVTQVESPEEKSTGAVHVDLRVGSAGEKERDGKGGGSRQSKPASGAVKSTVAALSKFAKFIGPGFMVAVAYIDPGNYATDVAAGAASRFQLLFIVLMSNIFAVILQVLAVRLGTVTGMNLAEHCRAHLPAWLNYFLYFLAEAAVIATDIAEVIGSAIALNLLLNIPLVGGCALTLVDVLLILLFYRPGGSMRGIRVFEYFVVALVLAVVVCFCIQLALIPSTPLGEVFGGYLPSSAVVEGQGIYLSCGILGATVMPHSLYLGSGIVQPRVRAYDDAHRSKPKLDPSESTEDVAWRPSPEAIKHCLRSSTVELIVSLTVFALFVNSAILIVAGASLSDNTSAQSADLFGVFDLLSSTIAPAAGKVFAVALLFSGTSAGIVATIAGQMISEGQINWSISPWLRRLLTRSISITPSIIIAAAVGREGLSAALNASQVVLSIILPFVSAPLIYFTCRNKFMTTGPRNCAVRGRDVQGRAADHAGGGDGGAGGEKGMRSPRLLTAAAVIVWLIMTVMNVALLVFLGLGEG